jgi:hypothetical protein
MRVAIVERIVAGVYSLVPSNEFCHLFRRDVLLSFVKSRVRKTRHEHCSIFDDDGLPSCF